VKLSVVDQSPVSAGMTPAQALRNTIDLARRCDRLGYHRYWIAEHHGMELIATSVPEVMIALAAQATNGIRVGSGAVLLPHYSPLKVAETFRMLHALFPGRIDLGLGRAPGGEALEAFALRRTRDQPAFDVDDFPNQLVELLAFVRREFPEDHPFAEIRVTPEADGEPEVWLLGSSAWSANAAGRLSLPYAFAHFINPTGTRLCIGRYQSLFDPSERAPSPQAIAAVGVVCAETDAEAEHLATTYRALGRRLRLGLRGPVPDPETAQRELKQDEQIPQEQTEWPRLFVGTGETVRAQLVQMAEALRIDEIMAVTITHDHAARARSYELLAEAFQLEPRKDPSCANG
jgi:luciferase family oxidoreductase group 1